MNAEIKIKSNEMNALNQRHLQKKYASGFCSPLQEIK
jgi:hypothetical protein